VGAVKHAERRLVGLERLHEIKPGGIITSPKGFVGYGIPEEDTWDLTGQKKK